MNTTLHGTLKSVYCFMGNLFFWPLTHLFLAISGWKQIGALVWFALVGVWIFKELVVLSLFPWIIYAYLATGLVTAWLFWYLFGTFKNGWFVYPTLAITGIWIGLVVAILL